MTRIGLLSDTHSYWDDKYLKYFEECDEIWHAGDIGSVEVAERLAAFRPFRAVYGNIDGQEIRKLYPQINRFTVDGAEVLMKHIGGYPGNYDPSIRGSLFVKPPKLFISYNPQIQISAESETKRSIFREKDKTKRSKKESAQHSKSRNKSFVMTSVSAL